MGWETKKETGDIRQVSCFILPDCIKSLKMLYWVGFIFMETDMKFMSIKNLAVAAVFVCCGTAAAGCAQGGGESTQTEVTAAENTSDQTTRYSISETTSAYDIGTTAAEASSYANVSSAGVVEDGSYTSMEEVSEYIHEFGHLPDNYITKNEAKKLGWVASEGNLTVVAPGKSIGGDKFGNREGLLPKKKGRTYYECDIDYTGGERNAKRLIYSNDGLIYYTEDHYNSFEQLY